MSEQRNPVVSSLASRSQHPYSSIAVSPDRKHAVAAGKDTLRVLSVGPQGLREIRSLRISQHFQSTVPPRASRAQPRYRDVRDAFQKPNSPQNIVSSTSTVVITDVAWSLPQIEGDPDSSVVAAAGSNGVVIVWNAKHAFLDATAASAMGPPPDAVLSQHSRAVNRLAWHCNDKKPGYLLTASQDATVKLWERRASTTGGATSQANQSSFTWFGMQSAPTVTQNKSVSWHCLATFEPKAEAVRDIRWSPFHDDVFAMVTDTGTLLVYNIHVRSQPWVRTQVHDGEATTVDWHPTRTHIIATGGAGDRCVKVWDLEKTMSLHGRVEKSASGRSYGSTTSERSDDSRNSQNGEEVSMRAIAGTSIHVSINSSSHSAFSHPSSSSKTSIHTLSSGNTLTSGRTGKTRPSNLRHILYISASVTRVIWRPPSGPHAITNVHSTMLAVATSPIKGASAGGNGILSLWSYHRPYMALSVVEGHKEGAVTDFVWLDIPVDENALPKSKDQAMIDSSESSVRTARTGNQGALGDATPVMGTSMLRRRASLTGGAFTSTFASAARSRSEPDEVISREKDNESAEDALNSLIGTWQHVLSVGRDGRCLVQSLARGDRPISRVSPSCFAMANLSPFQRGYGSLQIFSVHQGVPNGKQDDYGLTGLRQDAATSRAPGMFREPTISSSRDGGQQQDREIITDSRRLPRSSPQLVFNVIDQGDLDDELNPVDNQSSMTIAPEVVHLSRFAESYKLYPDEHFKTRVSLCLHNASIAERLKCGSLARMWRMVAALLKGSGMDHLPPNGTKAANALQFALVPCVKKLLEERANAGDVQTCVVLCEILQVLEVESDEASTCIPGLNIQLVREWYLMYIDLLQQMCLFSHASSVIGNCKDPLVGALNKQSTTIHEACPHCGKALLAGEGENLQDMSSTVRRSCNNCRRRIGFCFLCHEPVNGVFVWCPGCGHGGHLDHALEWFGGGIDGKPVRESCPTGCGHRCNLSTQLSAFPRTESFMRCHLTEDN